MKIEEILLKGKKILIDNKIEDAFLISRKLLENTLEMNRNDLSINSKKEIDIEQEKEYFGKINQILEGKPLQYITKKQEFMKLDFYVDENVLIPQPDTEILVEKVLELSNNRNSIEILDICTGSGCIGISLAKYLEKAKITLSDISNSALKIAKMNAEKNRVEAKINFINSDMYKNIENKFDIIVSNPPYIKTKIIETLDKQVQNEPKLALDGGEDGLEFYRILINESPKYLKQNGILMFEIGYDQKNEIEQLVKENKKYDNVQCIKDLSQNDRVMVITLKGE